MIGYAEAPRWSKNKEEFGKGAIEGIAGAEAANNAATGGAMVPTMVLGIPGSGTTAIILVGLMVHGLRPGPYLFTEQVDKVYQIFGAMMLADMGADIIRVERPGTGMWPDPKMDLLGRGRRSIGVDLKQPDGIATVLRLLESSDALLEGFRPGVMERLGLGPDVCLERNPRLVYGRMTGWGQSGPLANAAEALLL